MLIDFDGSLAAIVGDPADARAVPGTRAVLVALLERIGLVGVVSGRPVAFLAGALDLPGLTLVGQYGLERLEDGRVVIDPRAEPFLSAVASAAEELEHALPELLVERKAGVAVTVHWRQAPEHGDRAVPVVDEVAARYGLAVHPSRMARELRPPVPVDKGTAVEGLLATSRMATFAGDDRGDLDAFAALDRLRARGELEHAVKIAVGSTEAPPELLERSDLVVDGPSGLVATLADLVTAIDG